MKYELNKVYFLKYHQSSDEDIDPIFIKLVEAKEVIVGPGGQTDIQYRGVRCSDGGVIYDTSNSSIYHESRLNLYSIREYYQFEIDQKQLEIKESKSKIDQLKKLQRLS